MSHRGENSESGQPDVADTSRQKQPDVAETPRKQHPADLFAAGFAAGFTITGLLNPYDRALYLSVANRRRFLHPSNWQAPYQGLGQSLVGRVVSTGLWFPLERLARDALRSYDSQGALPPAAHAAVAGQIAGVANAMLLAPLSMLKYQTWGLPDGERSAAATARAMYRSGGASAFFRGLSPTVARDCVFGGCFVWSSKRRSIHRAVHTLHVC